MSGRSGSSENALTAASYAPDRYPRLPASKAWTHRRRRCGCRPLGGGPTEPARRSPPGPAAGRRVRRVLLTAALVTLVPAALSYLLALTGPSNSSFGIRSVEWLRDHGAAGIVTRVESLYYSLNAPERAARRCGRCRRSGCACAVRAGRRTARGRGRSIGPHGSRRSRARRCRREGRLEPNARRREHERSAGPRHHLPQRPARVPAAGRGRRLDQHVAHVDRAATRAGSSRRCSWPRAGRWTCRRRRAATCWRPSTAASSCRLGMAAGRSTATPTRR